MSSTPRSELPPDLARRLDDVIEHGDAASYVALLRDTDTYRARLDDAGPVGVFRGPLADEADALYPGGLSSAALTAPERLLALALVGPWLACAAGALAAAGLAEVLRRTVRRG